MQSLFDRMSVVFAAGCIGALVNSVLVWYLGHQGIPQQVGVHIAPVWSKHFLYPRIVWGGLWGFVFLLPVLRGGWLISVFTAGIFFSLGPPSFSSSTCSPFWPTRG